MNKPDHDQQGAHGGSAGSAATLFLPACGAGEEGRCLLDRARQLRQRQTEAEQRLWQFLRAKRLQGLKFRRQVPIGRYIVDFVCAEAALIVELDGGQHMEQIAYDQRRDDFLHKRGFVVLRFWNNQILAETEAVLESIAQHALAGTSPACQSRK